MHTPGAQSSGLSLREALESIEIIAVEGNGTDVQSAEDSCAKAAPACMAASP